MWSPVCYKLHMMTIFRRPKQLPGIYPLGSEESLSVTAMLVAVALNQGQIDRASALLSKSRETRLPIMEEGADG